VTLATPPRVTLPSPHDGPPRNAHAGASRDTLALACFVCTRALEPGERVVVQALRAGPASWPIRRLCLRCSDLLGADRGEPLEARCAECRRPMLFVRLAQTRRPATCGPACWNARRLRLGRSRDASRRAARGDRRAARTCAHCGAPLEGRRDARACSARCRQAMRRALAARARAEGGAP